MDDGSKDSKSPVLQAEWSFLAQDMEQFINFLQNCPCILFKGSKYHLQADSKLACTIFFSTFFVTLAWARQKALSQGGFL